MCGGLWRRCGPGGTLNFQRPTSNFERGKGRAGGGSGRVRGWLRRCPGCRGWRRFGFSCFQFCYFFVFEFCAHYVWGHKSCYRPHRREKDLAERALREGWDRGLYPQAYSWRCRLGSRRYSVTRHGRNQSSWESGVAASLCHRTPKSSRNETISRDTDRLGGRLGGLRYAHFTPGHS